MRTIVLNSWDTPQCDMFMASKFDAMFKKADLRYLADNIVNKRVVGNYTFDPDAVVRRDEHGVLSAGKNWRDFMASCLESNPNIRRMSYDFGYFAHYDSFMVDIEDPNGRSTIVHDWPNLAETVEWDSVPEYIQRYRALLLDKLQETKKRPPPDNLPPGRYVVIWPQQNLHLLRSEFREEIGNEDDSHVTLWITNVSRRIRKLGLIPVVKASPTLPYSTSFHAPAVLEAAQVYVHCEDHVSKYPGCKFEEDIGRKLMAHAAFHVVLCSSVTNELTLAEQPVVAMGRSWFNGLDIFSEPTSWDTLFDNATVVNHLNRAKWINWWLTRQCERRHVCHKLVEVYRKYENYL